MIETIHLSDGTTDICRQLLTTLEPRGFTNVALRLRIAPITYYSCFTAHKNFTLIFGRPASKPGYEEIHYVYGSDSKVLTEDTEYLRRSTPHNGWRTYGPIRIGNSQPRVQQLEQALLRRGFKLLDRSSHSLCPTINL